MQHIYSTMIVTAFTFMQVFKQMNLQAYDLNVDTLDVHAVSTCSLNSISFSLESCKMARQY